MYLLLFTLNSSSQSNVQIGALGVFSKTKGVGLEIADNIQAAKNFSIGLGIRPIAFNANISQLYIPVFGTVKYYYPLQKWKLFASFDPGYGIYPSEYISYISPDFHRNGAIYLSGGVGIMGASVLAPYASIHFTKFGFTKHLGSSKKYRPISTFNISAGIALNRTTSVYSKIRKPDVLPTEDDYYKKSKRQRNAGLLGFLLLSWTLVFQLNFGCRAEVFQLPHHRQYWSVSGNFKVVHALPQHVANSKIYLNCFTYL